MFCPKCSTAMRYGVDRKPKCPTCDLGIKPTEKKGKKGKKGESDDTGTEN